MALGKSYLAALGLKASKLIGGRLCLLVRQWMLAYSVHDVNEPLPLSACRGVDNAVEHPRGCGGRPAGQGGQQQLFILAPVIFKGMNQLARRSKFYLWVSLQYAK